MNSVWYALPDDPMFESASQFSRIIGYVGLSQWNFACKIHLLISTNRMLSVVLPININIYWTHTRNFAAMSIILLLAYIQDLPILLYDDIWFCYDRQLMMWFFAHTERGKFFETKINNIPCYLDFALTITFDLITLAALRVVHTKSKWLANSSREEAKKRKLEMKLFAQAFSQSLPEINVYSTFISISYYYVRVAFSPWCRWIGMSFYGWTVYFMVKMHPIYPWPDFYCDGLIFRIFPDFQTWILIGSSHNFFTNVHGTSYFIQSHTKLLSALAFTFVVTCFEYLTIRFYSNVVSVSLERFYVGQRTQNTILVISTTILGANVIAFGILCGVPPYVKKIYDTPEISTLVLKRGGQVAIFGRPGDPGKFTYGMAVANYSTAQNSFVMEEDYVSTAYFIIHSISLFGFITNSIAVVTIYKKRDLHNPFGILCAAIAANNAFVLAMNSTLCQTILCLNLPANSAGSFSKHVTTKVKASAERS
ncbi:hypothetical protein PRIPAC_77280 [Pristionchus pacificus]|uniref:G protein-coupled receptor n=1 Tax=Pristionchus pacificus TaxID=54126 RepID=A0A2A6CJI5_PRIPA|nr:hypothetical protein PRIPAC_77280 [Pristionchus pacificus]|eukprot:PDM78289.1 G protein-coupled receptor [Pristionchus pacificus]